MLDNYLKDVARSFLLFFIVIGPVIYKDYFAKPKIEESKEDMEADKYARMLNVIRDK